MSGTPWKEDLFFISEDVPEDECGFTTDYPDEDSFPNDDFQCNRPTWDDFNQCIWHAEIDEKPIDDLLSVRAEGPERLDGAYLLNVKTEDTISFSGCTMTAALFSDANLDGAEFINTDLTHTTFLQSNLSDVNFSGSDLTGSDLSWSDLTGAIFPEAVLKEVTLRKAELSNTYFGNANLTEASLTGADLSNTDFTDADLINADLSGANLAGASLDRSDLSGADLSGSNLHETTLTGADLTEAVSIGANMTDAVLIGTDMTNGNFSQTNLAAANLTSNHFFDSANLSGADLTGVDLTESSLTHVTATRANFELATFDRTDLFDTDLRGTRLYGAVFNDIQINSETEFGDHYTDELGDEEIEVNDDETHPRKKAIWSNRQVEKLAQENALRDVARQAYVERKELRREQYREDGEWTKYASATLAGTFTGYLEDPWRVVYTSLGVVSFWSAFYFLLGHIQLPDTPTQGDPVGLGLLPTVPLPDLAADVLVSVYFSLVTFTNLGYGDLQPTGWAQGLATVESFVGALLMALLVFVLGRRTTW